MITAVDTNILVDIIKGDQHFFPGAVAALRRASSNGAIVICDVVYAESCSAFSTQAQCDDFLDSLDIQSESLDRKSCFLASLAWISYLKSGGKRLRILPDFLVAAHASNQADLLLTRDRGFFKSYFPKLQVIDPSKP
jgi:predicted nucleic acid-binding protein